MKSRETSRDASRDASLHARFSSVGLQISLLRDPLSHHRCRYLHQGRQAQEKGRDPTPEGLSSVSLATNMKPILATAPHSSAAQVHFSPGSTFVLSFLAPSTLQVRAADSLRLVREWTLDSSNADSDATTAHAVHSPDQLAWSPDGQYVSVLSNAGHSEGQIQVLVVDPRKQPSDKLSAPDTSAAPGAVAIIKTGAVGVTRSEWGPASAPPSLFTFATDNLMMTIHSLVDGSRAVVQDVKRARYFANPAENRCFAVICRNTASSLESICIYRFVDKAAAQPMTYTELLDPSRRVASNVAADWTLQSSFYSHTNDAAGLAWSPDGTLLAVWEGQMEWKLHLFTALGYWRGTLAIDASALRDSRGPTFASPTSGANSTSILPDDTRTASTAGEEAASAMAGGGLGIRCCQWQPVPPDAPSRVELLAIGGYDEHVYILTPFTDHPMAQGWGLLTTSNGSASLDLSRRNLSVSPGTTVYRQPRSAPPDACFESSTASQTVPIPALRPDWDKTNPKVGISLLSWDPTGQWLAVRNECMPSTLFIYHQPGSVDKDGTFRAPLRLPSLHSIIFFSTSIITCAWRTTSTGLAQLAVITRINDAVYVWQPSDIAKPASRGQVTSVPLQAAISASATLTTLKYSNDGARLCVTWREDNDTGAPSTYTVLNT